MKITAESLITLGVLVLIAGVVAFSVCGIAFIKGHELAIKEEWNGIDQSGGDSKDGVYGPGKKIYLRVATDYVKYDMRRHHYKMIDEVGSQGDDKPDGPSYVFEVQGGQRVKVGWDIVWRYNREKLQQLHQDVRNEVAAAEKKILAAPCKLIAQNLVTDKSALAVYYGAGLKKLQIDFKAALLKEDGVESGGIIIESAVIITQLETEYTDQIKAKVVAEQKEISQLQLEKANVAEARAAKAFAEIDKNKRIIAAEASAREQVLAAEAQNEKVVLAAKAENQKRVLEAEGKRDAMLAEAKGVEAMKLAEAVGEEALKLAMYDGVAGERRASVEIADKRAQKLAGILQGCKVLPQDAFVALMNDNASSVTPVLNVAPVN